MGKIKKDINKQAPKTKTKVFKIKQKPGITKKKDIIASRVKPPALEKIKEVIKEKVNLVKSPVTEKPGKKRLKRAPKINTEKADSPESPAADKCKLNAKQVAQGVKALKDLIEKTEKTKNELFDDEQPIFLQVNTVKIPQCPARVLKLPLKHPLLSKDSEVCLITADLKGDVKAHEKNIEHYEEVLKKRGVATKIKTIIPYNQLKSEYSEYESKRRLVELYDIFLVDGRISGYVRVKFAKQFKRHRKSPISVKLGVTNLNESIEKALRKVELAIHSKGNSYVLQVAHSKMANKKVVENINGIFDSLDENFPGGADNIRSLYVKTGTSLAVPIYVTLKKNSEVSVPVILSKKPKAHKVVRGELSSYPDKDVLVHPTGEIEVTDSKTGVAKKQNKLGSGNSATDKKSKAKLNKKKKLQQLQAKKANGVQK